MTISLLKWMSQSYSNLRNSDKPLMSRLLRPIYYIYIAFLLSITKRWPWGTNVYDRNWDALIILDACRVDALREVEDEYEFLTVEDSITSVGSTSFEWMNHTFNETYRKEIQQTAYVTGNTYTERVLAEDGDTGHAAAPFGPSEYNVVNPDVFGYVEELWRVQFDDESEWTISGEAGSRVHPRYTTDRAITAGRAQPTEQLIVHYMYPHDPYPLATDEELFQPFDALRAGETTREAAWPAYLTNLRLVLDEVERLLKNLDAETVVITADHGEAFGEYGFYRHVIGCPLSCMREVPWVETSATDKRTYTPYAPHPESAAESTSAEKQLENLGYL